MVMDMTLIILGLAFAGVTLALVLVISRAQAQAQRAQDIATATSAERERELDDKVGELNRINAQLAGQMLQLQQQLNERHSELTRTLSERLDNVSKRVGDSMEATTTTTAEKLTALGERLVRIDEAQKEITGLTKEVVLLKDILANKQSRGAFGQTRMEAIIRDSMPVGSYDFQFTLTNGKRPDCILRLPNDKRVLVIDSKFPLESFTAFRDAKDDGARKQAEARVRTDITKHISDVREKYFIPDETQPMALIFVPSESIYHDLVESFDDLIQKGYRENISIISPSLLMMAVQVTQALVRDAKMREQAHIIQKEVQLLMVDVGRLADRVGKLKSHFNQAVADVDLIDTSANKILSRGQKIEKVDVGSDEAKPLLTAD